MGHLRLSERSLGVADERLDQSPPPDADTGVLYLSLVVSATWPPALTSMHTRLILLSCIAVRTSAMLFVPSGLRSRQVVFTARRSRGSSPGRALLG